MARILIITLLLISSLARANTSWNDETPVWEALEFFGNAVPQPLENSRALARDALAVEKGRQLIELGKLNEAEGVPISEHYRCIDCHNTKADAVGFSASLRVAWKHLMKIWS